MTGGLSHMFKFRMDEDGYIQMCHATPCTHFTCQL